LTAEETPGTPGIAVAARLHKQQQQHQSANQPMADNYALATDELTNERKDERTNRQTDGYRHRVKPSFAAGPLLYSIL